MSSSPDDSPESLEELPGWGGLTASGLWMFHVKQGGCLFAESGVFHVEQVAPRADVTPPLTARGCSTWNRSPKVSWTFAPGRMFHVEQWHNRLVCLGLYFHMDVARRFR